MNKSEYNNINIPTNLDLKIEAGVKEAVLQKSKTRHHKKFKAIGTIAASLVIALITLETANPALAAKVPVVGNVFEAIEKNIYFPGSYSQYATSVNETAYSNGIGITLSEIVCDGQSMYVTYIVENDEPFKNTSWGDSGAMDIDQLITNESYNKVDFTDKELSNSGLAGLNGKFVNENTFVGVEKFHLNKLGADIPDQFTFQTKINSLENFGSNTETSKINGTWAFKVPVTVNKDLEHYVDLTDKDVESDDVKITSICITPFEMIIDINYKNGSWGDYKYAVYNDNGDRIEQDQGGPIYDDDVKNERALFHLPDSDSNSIRIKVVTDHADTTPEKVFDKVIPIK